MTKPNLYYKIHISAQARVTDRFNARMCYYHDLLSGGVSKRTATHGERHERNVLFNDTLNTFYLRLYGVRHMVKDHSDSERGNPLPLHGLLFPISSKGSFICTIPQMPLTKVVEVNQFIMLMYAYIYIIYALLTHISNILAVCKTEFQYSM